MISNDCVAWWPRLEMVRTRKHLNKLQRLVSICITGATISTVTMAREMFIILPHPTEGKVLSHDGQAEEKWILDLWLRNGSREDQICACDQKSHL